MAGSHSLLAPSAAHRWMRCTGSVALEKDSPDNPSKYAAEGTVAHRIATECFQSSGKLTPDDYLGRMMEADGFEFLVTKDMVMFVQAFIDLVNTYAKDGQLLIDQRVDFSEAIGVADSGGTADAVIIHTNRVTVIDLKYGMGVRVDAENNEQMQLYALGTLEKFGMLVEPDDVVMVIHQPRLDHVSEACLSVEDLYSFATAARAAAEKALDFENPDLVPGEKQCRFCSAKATCPALKSEVVETVGYVATANDFADLAQVDDDWLSKAMLRVPLVEHWCLAIRAEVERRLFSGVDVSKFKLVEGRKGNRAWTDEMAAEASLKAGKLKADEIYVKKVISPTAAEKLLKKAKPALWEALQQLISRADGKPSVAPVTDKRPALAKSTIEDFRDLIADNTSPE